MAVVTVGAGLVSVTVHALLHPCCYATIIIVNSVFWVVARRRRLSGSGRQPIRIKPDLSGLTLSAAFNVSQYNYLINTILPYAFGNISALLSVDPVAGNLTASFQCTSRQPSGPNTGECFTYSSALPTCGNNPANTIPLAYMAPGYKDCTDTNDVRFASFAALPQLFGSVCAMR